MVVSFFCAKIKKQKSPLIRPRQVTGRSEKDVISGSVKAEAHGKSNGLTSRAYYHSSGKSKGLDEKIPKIGKGGALWLMGLLEKGIHGIDSFWEREETAMIFADDEMDFPKNGKKSLDLQNLSVQDLEDRIIFLESEIARARAMIAEKRSHRAGIESLFNTGE